MKYLKGLLYIFMPMIILTLLLTILNYFDILSSKILNYILLLIPLVSIFIGGIYVGKRSSKKGYIEGLKISGMFILLILLLSYLGLDQKLELRNIIYYLMLTLTSVFGSIIGINKK